MFKPSTLKLARLTAVFMLCFVFGVSQMSAQSQASTGQIAGTVQDAAGAVVANAQVKISNSDIGIERTLTSSDSGLFRAVLLPAGTYNVTATASGFSTANVKGIVVEVGRTADLNLVMSVGSVEQTVEVTADAVQVTRSEPDALINQTAIDTLPINGRRFQDFVTLTPSAQVDPSRGQISLSGQRGVNANVNIDGMDYNQPFFGGIRGGERSNTAFTVPQESIREFQVVAAGYSAEFGRSTGGVVTAITKSGTNNFHGSAFYLHRDKALAKSNEFFDTASTVIAAGRSVTPAPTQQQWGGSIGGPIVKDKMFFFGTYEQQRLRNPREVLFGLAGATTPPTAATAEAFNFYNGLQEAFIATNDATAYLVKGDWQITQAHRLNLRYNRSTNNAANANARGNAIFPVTDSALSNNGTEQDRTNTVVGQLASFFGTNFANELRGQWTREDRPRLANVEAPLVSNSIGNFGTVSFLPTTQYDWRSQFADNVTWTTGRHTLKFGGEYNHQYANQVFAFNQFGTFNMSGTTRDTLLDILGTGGATPNRFDSTAVTYLRQLGNGVLAFSTDQVAVFAQDSWKILPSLTLNLGLRWEGHYNPTPDVTNTGLLTRVTGGVYPSGDVVDPSKIPDQTGQWGPRFGFAWDPFKSGKTVVRGFSGIYYANTPSLLYAAPMNNFRATPGDLSISLPLARPTGFTSASCPTATSCDTVYEQLRLIGVDLNTFTLANLPVLSVAQIQSVAAAMGLPSPDPFTGAQPITITRNFKNPRSVQAGFGVEREWRRGWSTGADFTWINTTFLQRNRDINLPLPTSTTSTCATVAAAGRPCFGLVSAGVSRPVSTLGSVQVRDSSARGLYRALTIRNNFRGKRGQLNMFYTLSRNYSSDDNERDAGGTGYDNAFNLAPEYGPARIDALHQFTASPIVFLPWGFEVSSTLRFRSGFPIDARQGTDLNQDRVTNDRPFFAANVPFTRNMFRNTSNSQVDLRMQKTFKLMGEKAKLALSAELFNLFNAMNLSIAGTALTNYCASTSDLTCGSGAPTNLNFLAIRNQTPGATFGQLNVRDLNPGAPFQAQFGARFTF